MTTSRFNPVSVRGSIWGILSSYWFAVLAVVIVIGAFSRAQPALAMGVVLVSLAMLLLATGAAAGSEITVTDDEIIVRRRLRIEWRVAVNDLRTIEEHIPMRPRARSLAGWVFKANGTEKVTIEMALFAPSDRRRLRATFADVLVSPDLGRPTGAR